MVAFSLARNESTEFADVLLPLESHAEKDGTVTHPDGRIQRVRPSARRPGEVRPAWLVLTELSAMLGVDTGITSTPEALAAVASAVPFYGGVTDSEIAGHGVRWQERPAATSLGTPSPDLTLYNDSPGPFPPAGEGSPVEGGESGVKDGAAVPAEDLNGLSEGGGPGVKDGGAVPPEELTPGPPTLTKGQLLLGTYRDLWADPAVESSPALRFLVPAQRLEISGPDATRLGLRTGDEVSVRSGEESVNARIAVRAALPEGACFLIEGTPADNANLLAAGDGGPVAVEIGPPEVRLDLVTAGGPAEGDEEA